MTEEPIQFEASLKDDPWTVDPNQIDCHWHLNEQPWFPFSITLPPDLTITLHADGKWEGSIEGLREKLATNNSYIDANSRILLWVILREMERDARFW